MENKRTETPLRRALEEYIDAGWSRLHMPGHKGAPIEPFGTLAAYDLTEVEGTDSLFEDDGPLKELEEIFTQLYGTRSSVISAGGSTLCIQAMLRLVAREGGKVIAGRNIHAAAVNAMALLGLEPVWVYPQRYTEERLIGRIAPEDVAAALQRESDICAVYITSPDYFGVMSDIEGIAEVAHASGLVSDEEEAVQELAVQERETVLNVQIWKSYVDEMDISVVNPSGERVGPFREILGPQRFLLGNTELLIYYGEPKPYSVRQEIYISFLPVQSYVDSGVWRIILTPRRIVDGTYQMWLPAQAALNVGTAFLTPNSMSTLTVPSTASQAVTVAAYDARTFSYADFSGRGPAAVYEGGNVPKPDLAAPGVLVNAPVPGGGYRAFSGTSFAAPFVTGSAALLMEWGIVRGNDPYLYGEKVKAYLRRGARELPGYSEWPNAQLGYGVLCVEDSLPGG